MTKNSPATATGSHISIIGHITRQELLRYLENTEAGNGFANRFLWICVRRSKCLPEARNSTDTDLETFVGPIQAAIAFAGTERLMQRDEEAKELWAEIYPELSEGLPGLLGAVTGRAEAYVMRLAMVYALLDQEEFIRVPHLLAALAVWDYCFASCRYIFGERLGDPVADQILTAIKLQPEGMTRTQVRDLFSRHQSTVQIEHAIQDLQAQGHIRIERQDTGGRPTSRLLACTAGDKSDKSDRRLQVAAFSRLCR